MNDNRWDIPETEEGLQLLLARLAESKAAGDEAQYAWGLLKLARLVVWVRSDNHEPPFQRAGTLGDEALALFRRTDDRRGILAALLSAGPFTSPADSDARLAEAERIAGELGEELELANVWSARARALAIRERDRAREWNVRALEVYRRHEHLSGIGRCLFSLSIGFDSMDEQYGHAIEAIKIYREMGDRKTALKCVFLALMNTEGEAGLLANETLIREGLHEALDIGDRSSEGMFYSKLATIEGAKGNLTEAEKYLRWEREIESSDGLTPRERNKQSREMTKMLIAMAKQSGNKDAIAGFQDELKRLKKNPESC